ncbi:hypothetical protein LTR28_008155, partial [Elasticomyces elasticus]
LCTVVNIHGKRHRQTPQCDQGSGLSIYGEKACVESAIINHDAVEKDIFCRLQRFDYLSRVFDTFTTMLAHALLISKWRPVLGCGRQPPTLEDHGFKQRHLLRLQTPLHHRAVAIPQTRVIQTRLHASFGLVSHTRSQYHEPHSLFVFPASVVAPLTSSPRPPISKPIDIQKQPSRGPHVQSTGSPSRISSHGPRHAQTAHPDLGVLVAPPGDRQTSDFSPAARRQRRRRTRHSVPSRQELESAEFDGVWPREQERESAGAAAGEGEGGGAREQTGWSRRCCCGGEAEVEGLISVVLPRPLR